MYGYLLPQERRSILHPELQAELEFGIVQSKEATAEDYLENLGHFLAQDDDWRAADQEIVHLRDKLAPTEMPGIKDLEAAVPHEVAYQCAMWSGNFAGALEECGCVLAKLNHTALRGYRGLWNYLAGSAALLAAGHGQPSLGGRAAEHFRGAAKAVQGVRWLYDASRLRGEPTPEEKKDARTAALVERIEKKLSSFSLGNDRRFSREEKFILEGIPQRDAKKFEEAHARLGQLLGFQSENPKSRGAPDPWWLVDAGLCIVFEDHSDAEPGTRISVQKARQVASHPNWARENLPLADDATVIPVIVTPAKAADPEAVPHLRDVRYWHIGDFRKWATDSSAVIRELRRAFPGAGDLVWRAEAAQRLRANGMDPGSIVDRLEKNRAADLGR
jgi:hypothetical protein